MTGAELKEFRLKLEWTQKRLGEYLDVSDKTISSYERGYRRIPYPNTVLADALRHRLHQKSANAIHKRKRQNVGVKKRTVITDSIRRRVLRLNSKRKTEAEIAKITDLHIKTVRKIIKNLENQTDE